MLFRGVDRGKSTSGRIAVPKSNCPSNTELNAILRQVCPREFLVSAPLKGINPGDITECPDNFINAVCNTGYFCLVYIYSFFCTKCRHKHCRLHNSHVKRIMINLIFANLVSIRRCRSNQQISCVCKLIWHDIWCGDFSELYFEFIFLFKQDKY